jgi:hypothetical protein
MTAVRSPKKLAARAMKLTGLNCTKFAGRLRNSGRSWIMLDTARRLGLQPY